MEHPLDNPVWHALAGPHVGFAIGRGLGRHYPRDMAPFSGIAEPSAAAYDDLARDLPTGVEARVFRPVHEPVPADWEELSARPILQMVLDGTGDHGVAPTTAHVRPLTDADADAMLDLAEATKPGPVGKQTHALGLYLGAFEHDQLVAMAGERFRPPGHVELSAIAVHPRARRRGFASALIRELCGRAAARNETPFLHVFPDNPAAALYEHLGFRIRRELWVLWRRPVLAGDLTRYTT
jgi:predicted GNAT family acetyltransferase